MKIALPPERIDSHFNLQKQQLVFDAVVNHQEDVLLPAATHEPVPNLMSLAHDEGYVAGVYGGALVNGFGDFDPAKVRHAEQSTLALLAAARAAVEAPAGQRVAFAPASGFHHASTAHGYGFCTFNGLMVTALALKEWGLIKTVLIVDGDGHFGDGTEDILEARRARGWARHLRLDYGSVRSLLPQDRATTAWKRLAHQLDALEEGSGLPDLVLYQAGADAHKDDPYRAGYLDDTQWAQRDLKLFRWCRRTNTPVAWCLAGGYNGAKTLNLHSHTFATALRVYEPGSARLIFGQGPVSSTAETSSPLPLAPESTHHA